MLGPGFLDEDGHEEEAADGGLLVGHDASMVPIGTGVKWNQRKPEKMINCL